MMKTQTVGAGSAARRGSPPLDGGGALMALLIGLMGFYVLYPLILIFLNA